MLWIRVCACADDRVFVASVLNTMSMSQAREEFEWMWQANEATPYLRYEGWQMLSGPAGRTYRYDRWIAVPLTMDIGRVFYSP